MKLTCLSRIAAVAALALVGCVGVGEGAGIPDVVAVSNLMHPPFSSRDEAGRVVGIEVDLLAAAASQLGREVVWKERSFGELIPDVATGRADVAASTIGVTDERRKLVAFSDPYFETTIVALTRTGLDEPKTLADLDGRRIATDRGTTAVPAAAQRLPGAQRVLDRSGDATWAELLASGEVDAVVLDRSHAETFMRQAGTQFFVVPEALRTEAFAFALHPTDDRLRLALNSVIAQRRAQGAPSM